MKVLQINTVYKTASTGHITANIDNVLQQHEIESFIAYGRGNHKKDNLIKIGNSLDMYLHIAGTRVFDKHGLYSKSVTKEFIEKIKDKNFDIIHLHNIHGYYLNYEILFDYLKVSGAKVVWTLHDSWPYTGHCAYYDYIGCNKFMSECNRCPLKNIYPASYFFDNSKDNFYRKKRSFTSLDSMTIITPSKWLANEVKKSFLSKYDIKVINNGIDLNIFRPIKSDIKSRLGIEGKMLILGVANIWDNRKGLEYFIKLSKILSKDEVIVLVGLNDKQLKNLPSNIIGIKRTNSQEELAKLYTAADFFVNFTLEDNFPTTNLEALACGTRVLTFDSGGSGESVDKNVGKVFKKGDYTSIYRYIKAKKEEKLDKICSECVEKAKKLYNKDDRFLDYLALYKKLQKEGDV